MNTKKIIACYDENTIRVYQAYNHGIANEVEKLGRFGSRFSMNRMTWIKPSFLWMMYRCGWATKENQERVLAIDISIESFREILGNVVLSSFDEKVYKTYENWKTQLDKSKVRCQWDPDKDLYMNPMTQRAIQIGMKDEIVEKYVNEWIKSITDITEYVHQTKKLIDTDMIDKIVLPDEKVFELTEEEKRILGIDIL